MRVVPKEGEVARILQRNVFEVRNGKEHGISDEFPVAVRALGMSMYDVSLLRFASAGADFPLFCRSRDQHFARRRARLTQRKPGTSDAAATARAEIIDLWIRGSLLDGYLVPVEIELFRKNYGQRRHDALAHLGLGQNKCDAIVGSDAHPGVQWIDGRLLF